MKKLLGYAVGLGVSVSVIFGGISTASHITQTKSSTVYEATGNAVNDTIYGVMGAVSSKGINFSSVKTDLAAIGSSILPTSKNAHSKAVKSSHIDAFKPSENPNYVEGFH